MARGQSAAAEQQLGKTNAVAGEQGTEAQGLESKLIPGYESLMDTGYMNPAEEGAATTSEMGAATAPFESAKFDTTNRAAATRNSAGVQSNEDQLALEEGQTAGGAAADIQNQKMRNQMGGMAGIEGLESGNLSAMEDMYGLGPGTLSARAAGTLPHDFKGGIGPVSAGGGGCWIAAAVYDGWDDPRTIDVRRWLNTEFVKRPVGRMVMALYLQFGERIARVVRRSSLLKRMVRPLFDLALKRARG
jgi:hypothetical protein